MTFTRREFIQRIGIAVTSLMAVRCALPRGGESLRDRLRDCWLQFDALAQQAQRDYDRGQQMRDRMDADHRAALDDLVAEGELDAAIADELHTAFQAALNHIFLINAPITCYEAVLIDYTPSSSSQLAQQADLLAEMAASGQLDPATVAQAQAAIERDITFLMLSYEETQALYDALLEAAGDGYGVPSFDEIDLEISPEAAEAARFLVALLLEEP